MVSNAVSTLAVAAGLLLVATADEDANAKVKRKPDLVVRTVSNPPATMRAGDTFAIKETTRNRGRGRAGRSRTRFYLSPDSKRSNGDRRLVGEHSVGKLRAKKSATATTQLTAPTIAAGRFRLLACADDRRVVRERSERNNCRASKQPVSLVLNRPPVVPAVAVATIEEVPVGFSFAASDPDGDPVTIVRGAAPANGVLTGEAPDFTYTPNHNFHGTDSFELTATDERGASSIATVLVTVQPVNDVAVSASDDTVFYAQPGAKTIDLGLTVQDAENQIASATVKITAGYASGQDVLSFTPGSGITGSFDAATGTLSLSGEASPADYQAVLRGVKYQNTGGPADHTPRQVTFTAVDVAGDSASDSRQIIVNAPAVTTTVGATPYMIGQSAQPVDTGLTVSDPDSTQITGATVAVTSGFTAGDVLSVTSQLGITGSYDSGTGVLTLTGTASVSDYQQVLREVKFRHNGTTTGNRQISFSASDSSNTGAPAVKNVTVSGP